MEDKRKKNGGAREGAGRPKKADELKLIEKLDNLIDNDEVIRTLGKQIFKGDERAMTCRLYKSDAADDLRGEDIGGSRIIKKKKQVNRYTNTTL